MDSQTLILMLAISNLALSVGLFLFKSGQSTRLQRWSGSKALQALAWTLLFLSSRISPFLSILTGNCLLLSGVAMEVWASANSDSGKPSFLLSLWVVALMLFSGMYLFSADSAFTLALPFFLIGVFYLLMAAGMWCPWEKMTQLHRFVVVVTVTLGSLTAVISLMTGLHFDGVKLMQGNMAMSLLGLFCLMLINGFCRLLLDREQQEAELMRLVMTDPLTNAPNRRGFTNALAPWLALARRHDNSTALIMFDLDHIKRINDDYGHSVGDQVLKEVVDIGKTQLRDSDLIGRLGDEEFAVLLPRTNLTDAHGVAERMRQAIMALRIKADAEKVVLTTTASFGVTTIRPDDTVVSLVKRADDALSAAKNAGRNQVTDAAEAASATELIE